MNFVRNGRCFYKISGGKAVRMEKEWAAMETPYNVISGRNTEEQINFLVFTKSGKIT